MTWCTHAPVTVLCCHNIIVLVNFQFQIGNIYIYIWPPVDPIFLFLFPVPWVNEQRISVPQNLELLARPRRPVNNLKHLKAPLLHPTWTVTPGPLAHQTWFNPLPNLPDPPATSKNPAQPNPLLVNLLINLLVLRALLLNWVKTYICKGWNSPATHIHYRS